MSSCNQLADHLPDAKGKRILELGAGSGLPGICAARHLDARVTLSDYPDPNILLTLKNNTLRNDLAHRVNVVGHIWGEDASELGVYDVIIAADTLWMPAQHTNFCMTLSRVLAPSPDAYVHLVAGLHTGRHTIAKFMQIAVGAGFQIKIFREINLVDGQEREWCQERAGEDDSERRRWLALIVLTR